MAKGQIRSNREKRMPKQDKSRAASAPASPFSSVAAKQKADHVQSGKKGR